MEKVNTSERLAELRKLMKEHAVDVYSMLAQYDRVTARWCP
jgi:hypothetical protein